MILHFYEPPPSQKEGGLDQAIRSLKDYLVGAGHRVEVNPPTGSLVGSPDAVHLHGLWQPGSRTVVRWCCRRGVPYVVSPHGMLEPWAWRHKRWKKLPYYYLVERFVLRNGRAVLATSDQEASNLARFVPASRISVIPLGLPDEHKPAYPEARRKLTWGKDECVLLYLSRIHPKKGLHLLLHALASSTDLMPGRWRLVVVGNGEAKYVSECRGIARANEELWLRVEWKGAVWNDAKWDYLQGADLFCLPSFSENFGLAILEASQVGTRVLTTRQTPWSMLEDWQAAFLVAPEVESVRAGLVAFHKARAWSEARRQELSQRIHQLFSWEKIGQEYVRLYQQVAFSQRSVAGTVEVSAAGGLARK